MGRAHVWAAAAACLVASAASAQAPTENRIVKPDEKRVLEVGRWYNTVEAGLNLTQASYSDNWKGGEGGSVSWAAYLHGDFESQATSSLLWLNTARFAYGQTRRQVVDAAGNRDWTGSEKSADRVDLESFLRVTKGWVVDPYVSLRVETFFQDVTDPADRTLWFNPITFKEATGVARRIIDNENQRLTTRVGVAARETYRRFFANPAGGATASENAWDGGAEWITDYKRAFSKIEYTSRLSVYQPFAWSRTEDLERVPADSLAVFGIAPDVADFTTTADIDWQHTFSTKVTKHISLNLFVEWLYDKYDNTVVPKVEGNRLVNGADVAAAVRRKGQLKQLLGVGVTYRF